MTKWFAMRWLVAGLVLPLGCRVEPAPSLTPVDVATPFVVASAPSAQVIQAGNATATALDDDAASTSAPTVTLSPPVVPAQAPVEDHSEQVDERIYAWEDPDGSVHYGHLGDAPLGLRKRARPVTAEVGSVSAGDWASARGASTSAPAPTDQPSAEEQIPPSSESFPPAEVAPGGGETWSTGGVLLLVQPKRLHHPHSVRSPAFVAPARGKRILAGSTMHGGRRH